MRGGIGFAASVLGLCVLAGQPSWAASGGPIYSLINASATRVDFADQSAHMGPHGLVTFSILTVLAASDVAYSLADVSINCAAGQIAMLSNTNYTANGAPMLTAPVDSTAEPIAQKTLGQALQAVICNGVDPYPRSKTITGIAGAVAKAHDLMATLRTPPK